MPSCRIPGTLCSLEPDRPIDDGTTARAASPSTGPVCSEYDRTRAWAQEQTRSLQTLLNAGGSSEQISAYQGLIQSGRSSAALQALACISEIRRDVWVTLGREQRVAALREVHRVYMEAFSMGPAPIRFELMPQDGRTATQGQYDPVTGVITVDERLIVPAGPLRPEAAVVFLVATLVHESRHYLQWKVARYPKAFPSFSQADLWHADFYKHDSPGTNYHAYATQPVEADAFAIEKEVCEFLYPDTKPQPPASGNKPPAWPSNMRRNTLR